MKEYNSKPNMFKTCIYHKLCQIHNGSEDKCQGIKYGLNPCIWYGNITEFKRSEDKCDNQYQEKNWSMEEMSAQEITDLFVKIALMLREERKEYND